MCHVLCLSHRCMRLVAGLSVMFAIAESRHHSRLFRTLTFARHCTFAALLLQLRGFIVACSDLIPIPFKEVKCRSGEPGAERLQEYRVYGS
jgi:hypothetical protein